MERTTDAMAQRVEQLSEAVALRCAVVSSAGGRDAEREGQQERRAAETGAAEACHFGEAEGLAIREKLRDLYAEKEQLCLHGS